MVRKSNASNKVVPHSGNGASQPRLGARATAASATETDCNELIDAYAQPIAIAVIRQQLPGAVRQQIRRILMAEDEPAKAQLQEILQSIGLVIAAGVYRDCLQQAIASSQQQLQATAPLSLADEDAVHD